MYQGSTRPVIRIGSRCSNASRRPTASSSRPGSTSRRSTHSLTLTVAAPICARAVPMVVCSGRGAGTPRSIIPRVNSSLADASRSSRACHNSLTAYSPRSVRNLQTVPIRPLAASVGSDTRRPRPNSLATRPPSTPGIVPQEAAGRQRRRAGGCAAVPKPSVAHNADTQSKTVKPTPRITPQSHRGEPAPGTRTPCPSGLLDDFGQDRCLARLGPGARRDALYGLPTCVSGCGSLSVCGPPGTVDEAWLKKGLPCS